MKAFFRDLIQGMIGAAVLGIPVWLYLWNMKP